MYVYIPMLANCLNVGIKVKERLFMVSPAERYNRKRFEIARFSGELMKNGRDKATVTKLFEAFTWMRKFCRRLLHQNRCLRKSLNEGRND